MVNAVREQLHFAHGNGFPSPCYRQLLNRLEARFDCFFIDRVGHTEKFPVTENWDFLVTEVKHSIQSQCRTPVIAVGHSLGGILSLLVAIENPDLISKVILLDSPLLGRLKSSLLRFSKAIGMIDRMTPAYRTRGRRHHWHTREQALDYLKCKKLFKSFTDACLNDYIDYGMQKDESGYTLRFNPGVEYQIYRTIPHILHEYEGRLTIPSALIYGKHSDVIDTMDLRYMKKQYGIKYFVTPGTHMFPMEYPDMTANLIMDVVDMLR